MHQPSPRSANAHPRAFRTFARLALSLSLLSLPALAACSHDGHSRRPGKAGRTAEGLRLPKALKLPAEAPAMVYVQNPADGLARIQALSPETLSLAILVENELSTRTSSALAQIIADAADPTKSWAGVELEDGEALAHLPLLAARSETVIAQLSALPAAGEFGAVTLPPAKNGDNSTWLAWVRELDGQTWLTIGTSERALVTGELLETTFGKQQIAASLDVSRLQLPGEPPPVERIWVEGALRDLEVKVRFKEGFDPSAELPLVAGAMGELLRDPSTLLGASSRYRDHEKAVGKLISQIQEQVRDLPFLIKGFANDLAARFNAIARSWNGRFALAMADGHVRVAYGANDPKKAGTAVLHFLRGTVDGISLARNFSDEVPDLSLKKNAARSGDITIHRLTLRKLRGAPKELRPLLDDRRNLNIAFAFDARVGGGLVSVGPNAVVGMKSWLDGLKGEVLPLADAPEGALHLSLSLDQIAKLSAVADSDASLSEVWNWKAEGPPYDFELRKLDAQHWSARVRGPAKVHTATLVARPE